MRAMLIVNPEASGTSAALRDVAASALGATVKVDVAMTERRGHAAVLARQAARDGFDVVVAMGGDGTVNEVVNGLLADGPAASLPVLAVLPGGCTNVFARALGVPVAPLVATARLLANLREGRRRTIALGHADGRWFTFCAGLGFDAEVVRIVERHRRGGRRATAPLYVRTGVGHFFGDAERQNPPIILSRPGLEDTEALFLAIVSNAAPWSYLGKRPVNPTPRASFDAGLDLLGLRRMGTLQGLRTTLRMLRADSRPRGRAPLQLHDVRELTLTAERPLAFQLDGDYIGEREQVVCRSVPAALQIVC